MGKRESSREEAEHLITGVTEQPVRRPKRREKKYHSGKKCRTQKTGITAGGKGKIRSVLGAHPGKVHDFNIYKDKKNRHKFPDIPEKAGELL